MAARLGMLGYVDYRRSDASVLRFLRRAELTIGQLGSALGVTRQAARHVVDGLEARGYATATRDLRDSRRVRIVLTASGQAYADAVVDVIRALNHELTEYLDATQLEVTRQVLQTIIDAMHVPLVEGPRPS